MTVQRTDAELKAQGLQRVFVIEVVEGDILETGELVTQVDCIYREGKTNSITIHLKDGNNLHFGKTHSTMIIKFNKEVDAV